MKQIFTLIALFCVAAVSAQPLRTVTLTGNVATDFKAVERNEASGTSYALSWNATYLYIGVTGGGTYIKEQPTMIYIDTLGAGGKDTGFSYDGRRPVLPFTANCVIYFKASYAELRRDSAKAFGGWSTQRNVKDSVKTGTNDIEIRIPWKSITGKGMPANFAAILFKSNGDGFATNNKDAYEIKPGTKNKNTSYSPNINSGSDSIGLFYRFRTSSLFYNNINVFSWIDNKLGNLCATPAPSATPVTNITKTAARLNWTAVPGAKQYQVRRKKAGTNTWITTLVSGTLAVPAPKNFLAIGGLTCATSYDWIVRSLCDTSGTVDIGSGFTAQNTFTTLACLPRAAGAEAREINLLDQEAANELVVYPVPARKGSRINVSSADFKNNAGFSIYNIAGKQVQQGTINAGAVNLNGNVNAGTYILELRNSSSVVRKKIVVLN